MLFYIEISTSSRLCPLKSEFIANSLRGYVKKRQDDEPRELKRSNFKEIKNNWPKCVWFFSHEADD